MRQRWVKVVCVPVLVAGVVCGAWAQERSVFMVSPMAGIVNSDIQYSVPGSAGSKSLSDSGPLYALTMMYASPQFTIGSMGHYSKLDHSTESGYLFYGSYYFRQTAAVQPMIGFDADYVHVYTRAPAADIVPLISLNVDTSIWALHPIAGVSFKRGTSRVTPFLGYFNEQVDTSLTSEGMRIAGQTRNGFSAAPSVVLDYMSAGVKAEFSFLHFFRFDTKVYWRFKNGEEALLTTRNRLDIFLSPRAGIALKYDYFDDKFEKNSFIFIGPVFAF